jgi:glycogen debranching enzyme
VVNPEFRPLDIDYDRYVTIKNHLRKNNYNPNKLFKVSLFNVVDVGFNSIFLRANKDLVKLLKMFDLKSNEIDSYISRSEKKIVKLYNKKNNSFFNLDLKNNKKITIPSITNYFILFADLKDKKLNNNIIKNLKKHSNKEKYFFSSIKSNHRKFEEKRYWRGPVWINCNWIIYQGLKNKDNRFANQIKKKTIDLVKQKGFNEYFSCKTGKGFGATNFSWTASLFLDLILENKYE